MTYLICIIAYLFLLLGIGVFLSLRVKNRADFAVAGRSLSPWVMVLTMLACWIGTGSIVGNAGKTYESGLAAIVLPIGGFLGMICLAIVARRTRAIEASSVPEIIGQRFGPMARGLAVTALVIAYLVIVSYQFNAGGAVVQAITDGLVDQRWATLIAAICIISFASLAGLMSLAYQDVVTGIIITLTTCIACGIYWVKAGGWSGMEAAFAEMPGRDQHMQAWGVYSPVDMINFLLPAFLLVLGDANQYQRIFASRSAKGAGTAVTTLIFVSFVVELLIIATAWIASSLIESEEEGRYVLIFAAKNFLPLPLGCLFMVTIVGIILSTANSFLLVPATAFVTDVWYKYFPDKNPTAASENRGVWINRFAVIFFGLVAYGVSWMFAASETVFEKALYAYTIYGASITPTLLAAILWKGATKAGAISSITSGAIIAIAWNEVDLMSNWLPGELANLDAVLPAAIVSITLLIAVSLATQKSQV